MRIAILTGGGDAPGLNAVLRAVVRNATIRGDTIIGLDDGFRGLIEPHQWRQLQLADVTGIFREGGTILGTTNQANPLAYRTAEGRVIDCSSLCVDRFRELLLDALIVVGGDGTLAIAYQLWKQGIPIVGVPKTIDNDVVETEASLGFDTAVSIATEAVDRLHNTAEAHHRIMVVEVMGRYSGWIALHAGIAAGADVILIPEIPYNLATVAEHIRERERFGARFSIVVAAEGAQSLDGQHTVLESGTATVAERLGGIGARLAADLERATGREARSLLLGHLQRGGAPTSADRLLASRFGVRAMELVADRQFGTVVTWHPPEISTVALERVVGRMKLVLPDSETVRAARGLGISFGTERAQQSRTELVVTRSDDDRLIAHREPPTARSAPIRARRAGRLWQG
jgi:ATP-dependent phosphofructokinase / diphosphate-dependent phosphofructokinase